MSVTKKELDQFLTTTEQDLLQQFANNEILKGAVKKVLLHGAYGSGTVKRGKVTDPLMNFALVLASSNAKDEAVGKDVKICLRAIQEIQWAFDRIDYYEGVKLQILPKKNEAR